MEHVCRNDSLYPRSVYRCSECGTEHGTRAVYGAVNWQCPNELVSNDKTHSPAKQNYVGFTCVLCNRLITVCPTCFSVDRYIRHDVAHYVNGVNCPNYCTDSWHSELP